MTFGLSSTGFGLIIAIVLLVYFMGPLEFSVSMYFSLLLSAELEIDSAYWNAYSVLCYFYINVGCWSYEFFACFSSILCNAVGFFSRICNAVGFFSRTLVFPQYGFIAWLLSTCVGLLLSFLRYLPSPTTVIFVFDIYTLSIFAS